MAKAAGGGRLHELLAVEHDLGATAKKLLEEATVTFAKKADHFMGSVTSIQYLNEARSGENREDPHEITTTVADKLMYLVRPVARHIDTTMQKDLTNMVAKADLVVEGTVIATDLPATFLLWMENHLKAVRAAYQAIPTLKPGMRWEPDPTRKNVYVAPEQTAFRTEKVLQHKVLYEATKEHPAQIEKWHEDRPIARIKRAESSGAISPLAKSELLGRIDTLIRAVKKARQRANMTEVVRRNIGEALFQYIHGNEIQK